MRLSPARGVGRLGAFLLLLAPLVASGCAKSAKVSGKVYFNGQLLKGGNVTFVSTEGKVSASTHINEDGSYTLEKAPTGKVRISVETESLNPKNIKGKKYEPPAGQKGPEGLGKPTDTAGRYLKIPEHYADPEKSGLTYEVKGSPQEYDIKLEGAGR